MTRIGFRRGMVLRRYMYDFIEWFAPHLSVDLVRKAEAMPDSFGLSNLFDGLVLPEY